MLIIYISTFFYTLKDYGGLVIVNSIWVSLFIFHLFKAIIQVKQYIYTRFISKIPEFIQVIPVTGI